MLRGWSLRDNRNLPITRTSPEEIDGRIWIPKRFKIARGGQYPDGIAVDVSPKRLERYFVREDGQSDPVGLEDMTHA